MSLRRRWSRRSSPVSSKMRRRRCARSMGRGRISTEPSGSVSKKTVSPAFNPESTTQCFGSDTTYVEPPVSWSFRPSMSSPSLPRRLNHYRVIRLHDIDYIVSPLTTADSLESVGKQHRCPGLWTHPEDTNVSEFRNHRLRCLRNGSASPGPKPAGPLDRDWDDYHGRRDRGLRRLVGLAGASGHHAARCGLIFCIPVDEGVGQRLQLEPSPN